MAQSGPASVSVSSVALAARVSRQTVYRHWASTQTLIAAAVLDGYTGAHPEQAESLEDTIRLWLHSLRGAMTEVWRASALASVIASAAHDPLTAEILDEIIDDRYLAFAALISPWTTSCSRDDFAVMTGPVLFSQFFLREPASDALLERVTASTVGALSDTGG